VVAHRETQKRLSACCEYRTDYPGPLPAEHEIEAALRDELGLSIRVNVLPAGTVPRN